VADHPMKVYILKHIILIKHPEEQCPEDSNTPEYVEVAAESNAFADWLAESVANFGAVVRGPLINGDVGFEEHYLLCLHSLWPEMHGVAVLQTKLAKGEIFVADDHIYYAQPEALTRFDGQVLQGWYHDEHGGEIPDLDADLRRRLSRLCHFELRSLGYNGITIRELTPRWIAAVYQRLPAAWAWSWFSETLDQVLRNLGGETGGEKTRWFVYEALEQMDGPDLFPSVANGDVVLEVIGAMIDEPGEARQWLVKAKSLFGHSQLRYPEFESVRPLEKDEIFSTDRGVFWNDRSGGIMLGEVGGDMLHERHEQVVEDVGDRIRQYIIDSLAGGVEVQSGCEDFLCITDAIEEELMELDICCLWFHDIASLMDRVIMKLAASH